MAEIYPTDSELLNIQNDGETGVEFIATGQAPYYLHFRKLLYRLILATKRANDLRLYDEGTLNIGVKAGELWLDGNLVEFENSTANSLEDDKEYIYIYIDQQGQLVTDEYTDFPNMVQNPHIRLAIVTTANGQIDSITDKRSGHIMSIPYPTGLMIKKITNHTANSNLTLLESGTIHTNKGATENVTITLPEVTVAGVAFTFAVQENQGLMIDPQTHAISDDCGQTANKYKTANNIGASLKIVSDEDGNWMTIAKNGTWTEEA